VSSVSVFLSVASGATEPGSSANSEDKLDRTGEALREEYQQDINEDELAIALLRLINAAPTGFKDLRAGTGKTLDGTVTYPSSVPMAGAISTVIRISDDEQPSISATYYSGSDKVKGRKTYNELLPKVKRILARWKGDETERNSALSTSLAYHARLTDDGVKVSFVYNAYNRSGICLVYLSILSPKSLTPSDSPKIDVITPWQGGPLEQLTRTIIGQFVARDFEGIRKDFDAQMKQRLSSQMLEQGWNALTQQFGSLKSQDQPQTRKARGYEIVTVTCQMERGAIEIEVDFDTTGQIGGLWLRPANPMQ
jgi:hypothetical protein